VRNTPGVVNIDDRMQVVPGVAPTGREGESNRVYPGEGAQAGTATAVSTPGTDNMFSLHVQGLNDADRSVAERIIQGLRTDTSLVSLFPKVDIHVANGAVTLRGTVQTQQQKDAIGAAVQRATGGAVNNELQIVQDLTK
jgi:hypothetical protein